MSVSQFFSGATAPCGPDLFFIVGEFRHGFSKCGASRFASGSGPPSVSVHAVRAHRCAFLTDDVAKHFHFSQETLVFLGTHCHDGLCCTSKEQEDGFRMVSYDAHVKKLLCR